MSDETRSIPNEPPEGIMPGLWAELLDIASGKSIDALIVSPGEARMILASIVKARTQGDT